MKRWNEIENTRMKPKILFVDDEQNVLDSLRLSLRPLRGKWDMGFALGGEVALKVLSESPHEVVVSDMRMPGIDGAQLLHEVQQRYPECVRIILSGYADEGSVLKTVRLAHQYLSKPCRPVDIIQAVDKALSLRDVLASRQIKTIISKLETLPALPKTYSQLATALQDENTTLKTVGDIVGKDVAISASILRLVNSAFFGLPTRVSSIHHAVNLLGAQTLRVLVLSTHLFSCLENKDLPSFSVSLLWEHSLRVACFAKAIAEQEGVCAEARDDSFIAGMLHDVGKLVLSINMRAEFDEVLAQVRSENCPMYVAERAVFGTSHAEVGAYLMGLWGFNSMQLAAVCWHHASENMCCEEFSPQLAVHIANSLDHELVKIHEGYAERPLDLQQVKWDELKGRLQGWRGVCQHLLEKEAGNE